MMQKPEKAPKRRSRRFNLRRLSYDKIDVEVSPATFCCNSAEFECMAIFINTEKEQNKGFMITAPHADPELLGGWTITLREPIELSHQLIWFLQIDVLQGCLLTKMSISAKVQ